MFSSQGINSLGIAEEGGQPLSTAMSQPFEAFVLLREILLREGDSKKTTL